MLAAESNDPGMDVAEVLALLRSAQALLEAGGEPLLAAQVETIVGELDSGRYRPR